MPARELSRDAVCVACGRTIPQGTYLSDLGFDQVDRKWFHKSCPQKQLPSPPVVPSNRQEGSPAVLNRELPPVDQPIYSFHIVEHRENDKLVWTEANAGVSTRGRKPSKLEELDVAQLARNGGH